MPPRLAALRAWLGHRRLPLHLALLGVVLLLPSLWVGLQLDDYPQRLVMLGATQVPIAPLSVFATLPGTRASNLRFMDLGILPWWSAPDLKLAFCRPLSALSMWIDYRLFPDRPGRMHFESLLWFAALLVVVTLLYRRLLAPVWVAGLAALLYAVDPGHAVPVAWIANRNAVLATLFGALALLAHDRWRREGWKPGALWSAVLLALGLLSGEMALGAMAYLGAYALTIEAGGLRRRTASLVPAGLTFVLWAIFYRLAGFGTRGSGFYLDPVASPAAFAAALLRRAPLLLLGQWTPVPADIGALVPPGALGGFALAGWIVTLLLALTLLPLLRRDRTARFFGLGMLLAVVPSAATVPSNRLLFFVGFGAMGLLAQLLGGLVERAAWRPRSASWKALAYALALTMAFFHLVLSPLLLPLGAWSVRALGEPVKQAALTLPAAVAGRDVVAVNAPDYLLDVSFVPSVLPALGRPLPRRMRGLTAGTIPITVTRIDLTTLVVRSDRGFFEGLLGRLFRGPDRPLVVGQEIELPGMSARVMALTADGAPRAAAFRFAVPLEDPALCWLQWHGEGFVLFTPPAVGETVELPAPRSAFALPERASRHNS